MKTLALLIGFIKLLMTFPVVVDGGSMIPTFYSDEVVYASVFDARFGWMKDLLEVKNDDGEVAFGLAEELGFVNLGVKRGDIIVFSMPGFGADDYFYLKRVIGVSGDEIVIKEGRVYVNDELMKEPYLRSGNRTQIPDVAGGFLGGGVSMTADGKGFVYNVPNGKYFVLGDNREDSIDSRSFVDVYVDKKNIKGKFTYLKFP